MTVEELHEKLRLMGIVTRAELLDSGVSKAHIATSLRAGSLIRFGQGVYVRAADARQRLSTDHGQHLLRVAAAITVAGPGAVVSHRSAARLFGIDVLGKHDDVTLTCRPERGWKSRNGIHLYAVAVPPSHVTVRAGLPITTAARTVVDLARTSDFRGGVVAADSALHRNLVTKADLRSVVSSLPRRRGIAVAAEVIEFANLKSESPLESIARVVFRDVGLPAPELQVWIGTAAERIGRVDFYWQQYRTIVEVDGGLKYSDPARAKAQLWRDARLRAGGFQVVHLDWHDINETPLRVAAFIRDAFRAGAAHEARRLAEITGKLDRR